MGKHDAPPIWMEVKGNGLVPLSQYDERRVNSYQQGAKLRVSLWQGRNAKLLRKYWAILHKAVKDCDTPWQNSEEASDAIKLALGITDTGKTVNGRFFIRPGSISFSAMDEADFRDYFEKSMAILHKVTGVDPDTLSSEADDTGDIEEDSAPNSSPVADEAETTATNVSASEGDSPPPGSPSPTGSAGENASAEAGDVADGTRDASPAPDQDAAEPEPLEAGDGGERENDPSPVLPDNERERLIFFARNMLSNAADAGVSGETISNTEKRWATEFSKYSEQGQTIARQISKSARVIRNEDHPVDMAREHYAEMFGCSVEDLTS